MMKTLKTRIFEDDLFLDIVVFPNGTAVVIDEEELQSALNKKEISKQDYELAYNVVKNIKEEFIDNFEHLKSFTEQINAEINFCNEMNSKQH